MPRLTDHDRRISRARVLKRLVVAIGCLSWAWVGALILALPRARARRA